MFFKVSFMEVPFVAVIIIMVMAYFLIKNYSDNSSGKNLYGQDIERFKIPNTDIESKKGYDRMLELSKKFLAENDDFYIDSLNHEPYLIEMTGLFSSYNSTLNWYIANDYIIISYFMPSCEGRGFNKGTREFPNNQSEEEFFELLKIMIKDVTNQDDDY